MGGCDSASDRGLLTLEYIPPEGGHAAVRGLVSQLEGDFQLLIRARLVFDVGNEALHNGRQAAQAED
jgi:hypothetical protein